jgi:hypothetical protein
MPQSERFSFGSLLPSTHQVGVLKLLAELGVELDGDGVRVVRVQVADEVVRDDRLAARGGP